MISRRANRSRFFVLMMPTPNQSITTHWASLPRSMLLSLALCISLLQDANCQALNATADEIGVRHAIIAVIEADPDLASANANNGELKATVRISVRILDYAPDSRFYGVVDGNFQTLIPAKGLPRNGVAI
jgi:hypothetical protein